MRQVKLFKGIESDVTSMEQEINAWIRESGARVVSISGNIAPQSIKQGASLSQGGFPPSDVLVMVLYETGS